MKLQKEGTFNARIVGQSWEFSRTNQPICKIQFETDEGSIQGGFYFDQDPPKYGTETALDKNSRNFAGAIPGWTAENMDREQTYIGAKVTITAKYNQKGYLNVSGIYPLGGIEAKKVDPESDIMKRLRSAVKVASAGVTPPQAQTEETRDDFADDKPF